MTKLISIITPYYNGKRYLKNFLDNLENQISKNFELIIVDDCSKKSESKYLKEIIKKYNFPYHIYRNKKNKGPGYSRNVGLNHSSCSYVTFIDSDDTFSKEYTLKIEKVINESNPDCIVMDYFLRNNNKIKLKKAFPTDSIILDSDFALAMVNGMCWGKVFNKNIINDYSIQFPIIMRSEDLAFVKTCISKCEKIYYLQEALYYYTSDNSTSIMHRKNTLNINNNIEAFKYIEENVNKSDALEMVFIREYLYLIVQIMIIQGYKSKDIKEFIDNSINKYPNWSKNKYLKYQPLYLKLVLYFIKHKFIFPIKIIFKFKR